MIKTEKPLNNFGGLKSGIVYHTFNELPKVRKEMLIADAYPEQAHSFVIKPRRPHPFINTFDAAMVVPANLEELVRKERLDALPDF